MDKKEQNQREGELDRFWDIDALLPKKRSMPISKDVEAVDITDEAPIKSKSKSGSNTEPKRFFIPPHTENELLTECSPDEEYSPDNSLISKVQIFRIATNPRYYKGFLEDAKKLFPVTGVECQHIPFFSYIPQYVQMNRAQLKWYLWWRENFKNENYIATDYSYLLLYAYEIINLGSLIPPRVGQKLLCSLWINYRNLFHQLDNYLPNWICDYSLLHHLPPPTDLNEQLLSVAMSHCALKEFYVSASNGRGLLRGIFVYCSNYDFHKSKFFTKENEALFEGTVLDAIGEVLKKTGNEKNWFGIGDMEQCRMMRLAYNGALCADSVKRKIALEYTAFSCSHSLRLLVTDIVKYTENHLRAYLGIRARLGIYALPSSMRNILDAYLNDKLPRPTQASKKSKQADLNADYEKNYELPQRPLSLDNAAAIERRSWQITEKLVEAFDEEVKKAAVAVARDPQKTVQTNPSNVTPTSMFAPYLPFLQAVLEEDATSMRKIAQQSGKMIEVLVDEINELAADALGDILLEEAARGFVVIDEYREEAFKLIRKGKNNGTEPTI